MGKPARKLSREDKVLADIAKGFQGIFPLLGHFILLAWVFWKIFIKTPTRTIHLIEFSHTELAIFA